MDASLILENAAGLCSLPFSGASKLWDFVPERRTYNNLVGELSGQNFEAVLIGDDSVGWNPGGELQDLPQGDPVTLILPEMTIDPGENVTIPLEIVLNDQAVVSADLRITYDQSVVQVTAVTSDVLTANWATTINWSDGGIVKLK